MTFFLPTGDLICRAVIAFSVPSILLARIFICFALAIVDNATAASSAISIISIKLEQGERHHSPVALLGLLSGLYWLFSDHSLLHRLYALLDNLLFNRSLCGYFSSNLLYWLRSLYHLADDWLLCSFDSFHKNVVALAPRVNYRAL